MDMRNYSGAWLLATSGSSSICVLQPTGCTGRSNTHSWDAPHATKKDNATV